MWDKIEYWINYYFHKLRLLIIFLFEISSSFCFSKMSYCLALFISDLRSLKSGKFICSQACYTKNNHMLTKLLGVFILYPFTFIVGYVCWMVILLHWSFVIVVTKRIILLVIILLVLNPHTAEMRRNVCIFFFTILNLVLFEVSIIWWFTNLAELLTILFCFFADFVHRGFA